MCFPIILLNFAAMKSKEKETNKIVLVADSGSTKTDWALAGTGVCIQTQGLNPVLMDEDAITDVLRQELFPHLVQHIAAVPSLEIFFYGAGVRDDQKAKVQRVFVNAFAEHAKLKDISLNVYAESDLFGAARALCGHHEGIACILGTGANSCLFDGERIVQNTPALGFILGDEGGGAALGKRFLNAIFKGLLPAEVRDDYLQTTHQTLDDIIRHVYREPMANRYLASTSLYIGAHLDIEPLRMLVVNNFREFFLHHIVPYQRRDLAVNFVGSIACHYEPLLREAAEAEGFHVGTIVKSPIDSLCDYHGELRITN